MQSVGVPLQVFVLFNNLISSSSLYFFFCFNGIEGNNSGDYCVHMVVYISAFANSSHSLYDFFW